MKNPDWICAECGETYGRRACNAHATWHKDMCGVCGKVTSCTEPRDFGYLRPEWISVRIERQYSQVIKYFCVSCGDRITTRLATDPSYLQKAMYVRCRACALEILGLSIPNFGTLQHGTGGGQRVIRDSKTQS